MVAFATQVKRRRGTEAQNNEFTGAEGEIVVDLTNMTLRVHDGRTKGGFVVGGGAGRNIGDVFFTARTDTTLNGAVEANGGQYNTTDFVGSDSIGNILSAGKVPYVAIADFDTAVANNGECTSFGWDGGTVFKVPKINGRRLIRRQLPTADNNYTWYNLYSDGWVEQGGRGQTNVSVSLPVAMSDSNYVVLVENHVRVNGGTGASDMTTTSFIPRWQQHNANAWGTGNFNVSWQVSGYAAESEYNDKSTWQYDRYMRPMVQLANGATDEAVVVAGNVLSDISSIKQHIVVEFQAPTADNGYTWYRKYADGWVEQGGTMTFPVAGTSQTQKTITFPIAMADTNYTAQPTPIWSQPDKYYGWVLSAKSTTSMTYVGHNTTQVSNLSWFVCGMAAQ